METAQQRVARLDIRLPCLLSIYASAHSSVSHLYLAHSAVNVMNRYRPPIIALSSTCLRSCRERAQRNDAEQRRAAKFNTECMETHAKVVVTYRTRFPSCPRLRSLPTQVPTHSLTPNRCRPTRPLPQLLARLLQLRARVLHSPHSPPHRHFSSSPSLAPQRTRLRPHSAHH